MIRPVVLYGSSVLRQVARPVGPNEPLLASIVSDLFETMHAAPGIGLAAPQVGLPLQLFVVGGRIAEDLNLAGYEETFINPSLVQASDDTCPYEEGCLSIPNIQKIVSRPSSVCIRYENARRECKELQADGLLARVIQHEYDHLYGKLFLDYLSSVQKRMLQKKLVNLATNCQVDYPVVLQK